MRTILWILAGTVLGLIIHLVVVLSLPDLARDNTWSQLRDLNTYGHFTVLEPPEAQQPNPYRLDPELVYAVCQLDLASGPGVINGPLPDSFWSVSVFDEMGNAFYGTTSRSGLSQNLQLGIFNPEQTRRLAEQQLEVAEGLLIVETDGDDVFVVVRLALPYPALRERYTSAIAALACGET